MAKNKHAHHGGAWKVAYADFVTAMMALFLVLWLTSQDEKIKEAVERSFKNPFSSINKESTGIIPNKDTLAVKSTQGNFDSASAVELNFLRKMADDIMKSLQSNPDEEADPPMKLELLPDGMRISIFDRAKRPNFEKNTAQFTDYGQWVFSTLAWQVARYTNTFMMELEGHTEKGYVFPKEDYGAWEITTDRANSARRKMIQSGVANTQVRKVAGYADTMPMADYLASDESNRRVAVLLKVKPDGRGLMADSGGQKPEVRTANSQLSTLNSQLSTH